MINKWKKMIKNEKKMRKIAIFQKMKNCNFPRVFFIFFIFFSFFIIFASSGAKILQEMENYNFPSFFSFFYHFFIFLKFLLPVLELMKNDKKWWKLIKNDKKMEKMENNDKTMKKWKKTRKIAIFQKMKNCNFPRVFFIFFHFFNHFFKKNHFCFQWWNWCKMIKNDEKWKKLIKKWKKW